MKQLKQKPVQGISEFSQAINKCLAGKGVTAHEVANVVQATLLEHNWEVGDAIGERQATLIEDALHGAFRSLTLDEVSQILYEVSRLLESDRFIENYNRIRTNGRVWTDRDHQDLCMRLEMVAIGAVLHRVPKREMVDSLCNILVRMSSDDVVGFVEHAAHCFDRHMTADKEGDYFRAFMDGSSILDVVKKFDVSVDEACKMYQEWTRSIMEWRRGTESTMEWRRGMAESILVRRGKGMARRNPDTRY